MTWRIQRQKLFFKIMLLKNMVFCIGIYPFSVRARQSHSRRDRFEALGWQEALQPAQPGGVAAEEGLGIGSRCAVAGHGFAVFCRRVFSPCFFWLCAAGFAVCGRSPSVPTGSSPGSPSDPCPPPPAPPDPRTAVAV